MRTALKGKKAKNNSVAVVLHALGAVPIVLMVVHVLILAPSCASYLVVFNHQLFEKQPLNVGAQPAKDLFKKLS